MAGVLLRVARGGNKNEGTKR